MHLKIEEIIQTKKDQAIEETKKNVLNQLSYYIDMEGEDANFEGFLVSNEDFIEGNWDKVWRKQLLLTIALVERQDNLLNIETFSHMKFDVREWLETEIKGKWVELLEIRKRLAFLNGPFERCLRKKIQEERDCLYIEFRCLLSEVLLKDIHEREFYKLNDNNNELIKININQVMSKNQKIEKILQFCTGKRITKKKKSKIRYQIYQHRYDSIVKNEVYSKFLYEQFKKIWLEQMGYEVECDFEEFCTYRISESVKETTKVFRKRSLNHFKNESLEKLNGYVEIPFEIQLQNYYMEKKEQVESRLREEKEERERQILHIFGNEYEHGGYENTRYVLHIGGTNTGKTYQAIESLKKHEKGVYLAPLRLLALEVYEKLNKEGIPCTLKTGEETKEEPNAMHESCTVEMFNERTVYDIVVIDEAQLIGDKERGFSWYRAIAKAKAKEVHIIGNPSMKELIVSLLGEENVEIIEYVRKTPLVVQSGSFEIRDVVKGDALIAFSRKRVLQIAATLEESGHKVSVIYGNMPPESRQRQMEKFNQGETNVVVATDAIGMGLNLPIRRIIFMDTQKFDGTKRRDLHVQEVKQIAGRAGRIGVYEEGIVVFPQNKTKMKKKLIAEEKAVQMFTIAPTRAVINRYATYSKDLGEFFGLWKKYKNPKGTIKASLMEERNLYQSIRDTVVEHRMPMAELYSYLQMPFSSHEPVLANQWKRALLALTENKELEEPSVSENSLEELEFSYKSVELHLMFLYRLNKQTQAYYWERIKKDIAQKIDIWLRTNMKSFGKKCNRCQKKLSIDYPYGICEKCYYTSSYEFSYWD